MKRMLGVILFSILSACGGGGSSAQQPEPSPDALSCDMTSASLMFKDVDLSAGKIGGEITLVSAANCNASSFLAQWVDTQGGVIKKLGTYSVSDAPETSSVIFNLPQNTSIAGENTQLQIIPMKAEKTATPMQITVVDRVGVAGPGGSHVKNWVYGSDGRPLLPLQADRRGDRYFCVFDNGNVLVHDAKYNEYSEDGTGKNTANDVLYPAYEFDCTDSTVNNHRKVWAIVNEGDEDTVHSYSLINDAMYYGDVVFNMYEELLGVRPFDKLRIRPHFGAADDFTISANWDGAYINLGDDIYYSNGLATLETLVHEATHAMLNQHSSLVFVSDVDYHKDGLMLHEAFSDIATVKAHHYLHNKLNWIYGDENQSSKQRFLDEIVTEEGAITSYFDYDDAGANQYKRMGLITYPFYVLTQKWGVDAAFHLFLTSAKECWSPTQPVLHAAQCVLSTAETLGVNTDDVMDAFRHVKIKLKEKDTLAHYTQDVKKLRVQFSHNVQSDFNITTYLWEFGDGQQDNASSPYHVYANKGTYTPKLTIEDDQGNKDTFYRTLTVTDEYCQPYEPSERYRQFDSVLINGTDINFDANESDYTSLPVINVISGVAFPIVVTGTVLNAQKTQTGWNVRVDLNDDGEFANDEESLLEVTQENNNYSFNHMVTIPAEYSGQTLYMRLNGDARQFISSCRTLKGSSVDVRIKVL